MALRLIGIYDAEGSLAGELRYVLGKLRGTHSCSLCDITHGPLAKKKAFIALERRLRVPIALLHLDELDAAQRLASGSEVPCVLLEQPAGLEMLIRPVELERLAGSVDAFEQLVRARLRERFKPC